MKSNSSLILLLFLLVVLLSGCGPSGLQTTDGGEPAKPASHYFKLVLGEKVVDVQLALNDAERGKGLMYRDGLEPDHGMLFVFGDASPRGFWMANVRFPLDVGYFDATGTLREVHQMYAGNRNATRSLADDIQFALEMNKGWFARSGLRPGVKLDLKEVAAAIGERGFDPAAFNLNLGGAN